MHLSLPFYYIIEPTNICNFQCPICPNSLIENQVTTGMMSLDLFDRILNQISERAKVIQLYWLGEPLLNKNIFWMIQECKRRTKAKIIISTNGSILSPEVYQRVVDSGLDEIIISVDACDSQDIYGKIRAGGNIEILNSNIQNVLINKGTMSVILQFVELFINQSEKEKFFNKWKSFDCKMEISCLYTWANQIPSLNLASNNLSPVLKKRRVPCADLWNKMVIRWDGKVCACCFDYANRLIFGNCENTSLEDIWNSSYANTLRRQHMQGEYPLVLCSNCDAWAESEEYKEMYHL